MKKQFPAGKLALLLESQTTLLLLQQELFKLLPFDIVLLFDLSEYFIGKVGSLVIILVCFLKF